jgi:alkylation response protein AidB-like acyl-CoA dehydrogenase
VIADGSVLWDVLRKTFELGYHKMGFPAAVGGIELDPLSNALVTEEMGWASPGLAVSRGVCTVPFSYAMLSPDPEVQGLAVQFCADTEAKMTGCWAITEPDHGSDWLIFDDEIASNPACTPRVRAVLDGDDYVINGQKSAWVSMGTVANHAALFLCLDPSKGPAGGGIAAMPLDLPGVTRGKPLDKLGQRDLNQGEIFFDNVRIPKSMMVVQDSETYQAMADLQLTGANGWMGSCFTGCAHSAYDEALSYAKERVQGGRPIIEHQNIKLKLFDMFTSVEAARSLSRRNMVYNGAQTAALQPPALEYAIASKVFATEASFRVASEAIQIFGGNGLSREYVIEKIFRDARAAMIEDGVNETLALGGASRL